MTLQVKLDEHGSIGGTRYHKGDLMTKVGLGGTWWVKWDFGGTWWLKWDSVAKVGLGGTQWLKWDT